MNKLIIQSTLLILMLASGILAQAQCDDTAMLKGSTTNFLNEQGEVERSKEQDVRITISKTSISLGYGDADHNMTGQITSRTCQWKTPYRDGSMVIDAVLSDAGGTTQQATFTITGTSGKVTLTYVAKERPGVKIMVVADQFEQKKL